MTARLVFLCKGMDASSREAESPGTSLPTFAKVRTGKTCATHSNILFCAMQRAEGVLGCLVPGE